MAQPSANSFLKRLERSGIVAEDTLAEVLNNLKKTAAGRKIAADELIQHLIESGVITQWHTDKLLAGKYKGFFLGKFKLLGHLGTGGMSSVYLAESKVSGQRRAIKVLPRKKVADRSYLDRFYREGKAAARLNHPNVVKIYDICNDDDTHYMVMEHVKGSDLYERVKAGGAMSIEDAVDCIVQSAQGLQHAHAMELVHRDIKPANLLKTDTGVVKILDLGLALMNTDEDEESLTVLHNEKVMGTADYLSPEQAVNSHEVDLRSDIYSLGCTLFYLLTARAPFNEGSLAQRIAKHQTQPPPHVSDLREDCPRELSDICYRMMEKKPENRFADCRQVETALQRFLEHWRANPNPEQEPDEGTTPNPTGEPEKPAVPPAVNVALPEFAIDTGDSGRSGAPTNAAAVVKAPVVRRKQRKKVSPWVLPMFIIGMLLMLVLVLIVVIKTLT